MNTFKTMLAVILATYGIVMAQSKPKIEVIGLSVAKPKPGSSMMSKFPGAWAGTSVGLELTLSTHKIIELSSSDSTLTTFKDDKGKSLLPKKQQFGGPFSFPSVSDDKQTLTLSIKTEELPQKGASTLMLEGELALMVGNNLKTKTTPEIPFKKGEMLTLGKTSVEISSAGKPKWGTAKHSIQLKANAPLKFIKSFDIVSGGKTIEGKWSSSGSFGMMGAKTYTTTFSFKETVEKGALKIAFFDSHGIKKVPIKMSVSLGL